MNDTNNVIQRVACKAVIVNDGKALILREATTYKDGTKIGRYGLPGGRINPGEAFLDGLRREITEESGLTVHIEEPVYVGEWFPEIRGVKNQIIGIFFICQPEGTVVRLSDEHDAYEWIGLKELAQFDVVTPDVYAVRKVLEGLA